MLGTKVILPESSKFLIYNTETQILADNDGELAQLIENTVKSKGFLEDEEFLTPSIISVKCLGDDKWEFVNDSLK